MATCDFKSTTCPHKPREREINGQARSPDAMPIRLIMACEEDIEKL